MSLNSLIEHLGVSTENAQLKNELARIGIEVGKEVRLPDDEYRAYVERQKLGMQFVFTDEAVFKGVSDQTFGTGQLFFSGLFLFSEGKDGYSQFLGSLPMHLSFDMTAVEIFEALGESSWKRERPDGSRAADRWDDLDEYSIHITYRKSDRKPSVILLSRPDDT